MLHAVRCAALPSCLREYLFSEALVGLGLDTVIAVSVCATGESTMVRNAGGLKSVPGAVLCRTAPSMLRFGSFELPARRSELRIVRSLADFCLQHLRPHLATASAAFEEFCLDCSDDAQDASYSPQDYLKLVVAIVQVFKSRLPVDCTVQAGTLLVVMSGHLIQCLESLAWLGFILA